MKRIASIQDVSCLGRCSQTVALPVVSAMGVECAILPTAGGPPLEGAGREVRRAVYWLSGL